MHSDVQKIPKSLIYEVVDGNPIYYKGYKDFLLGRNHSGEPMGSSLLQSMIITQLVFLLHEALKGKYYVFTNELGLQISKGTSRAADIAIFSKSQLPPDLITNKYSEIPPRLVIEIDTRAEVEEIKDTFTYYNKKTDQLLAFGVGKVIWVFTDSQKVLIAERGQPWQLVSWDEEIDLIDGVSFKMAELVETY